MQLFKINTASFKTRLIFSFVMAGLVTLVLVVVTITQMVSIVELENDIVQVRQPTQVYLQTLKSSVQESMYVTSTNFEEDKTQRRVKWDETWNNNIQPSLDSLRSLRKAWTSSQAADTYRKLEKYIQEMKPLQNDCMVFLNRSERFGLPPGDEYYLAKERLVTLHANVKQLIEELMDLQKISIERDAALVETELKRFRSTELILLFIAFTVGILIAWYVSRGILIQIRQTRDTIMVLSSGNFPKSIPHFDNELREIIHSIELLVENFKKLKSFALQVGEGDFDNTTTVFDETGELGIALEQMRSSLHEVSEKEQKRAWQNRGISKFVEILRENNDDLKLLGDEVIRNLTQYLNCNQGGIYLAQNAEETYPILELVAYYAFEKKKFIRQQFDSREGLIGQAFRERQLIHLTEIPEEYALITSGVGGARPKSLIISPLKVNDLVFGVVEMASFHFFEDYQVEFIEKLSENIAATFANVQMNVQTRALLRTSQQQAEQMRSQEEEMRQNLEELQATQEEMRRKAALLEISDTKSKAFFEGAINPIFFLDKDGAIDEMNASAEDLFEQKIQVMKGKSFNELLGRSFKEAIGKMQHATVETSKGTIQLDFYVKESVLSNSVFYIAYLRDVTALMQEREANRMKVHSLQEKIERTIHEQQQTLLKQRKEQEHRLQQTAQKVEEVTHTATQWKDYGSFLEKVLNGIPLPIAWKDASLKFMGANNAFMHLASTVRIDYLKGKSYESTPWAAHAERLKQIEQEVWLSGNSFSLSATDELSDVPSLQWIPIKRKADGEVTALVVIQQLAAQPTQDAQWTTYKTEIARVQKAIQQLIG